MSKQDEQLQIDFLQSSALSATGVGSMRIAGEEVSGEKYGSITVK